MTSPQPWLNIFDDLKKFPPKEFLAHADVMGIEKKRYKAGWYDKTKHNLRTYNDDLLVTEHNRLGFRGPDVLKYTTNKKIVCVGCSLTEGEGVKYEHTWPHQLQKRIQDKLNVDVSVFNLGRRSAGAASIFRILYGLITSTKTIPDVVIVLLPDFDRHEILHEDRTSFDSFFRVFSTYENDDDLRKHRSMEWLQAVNTPTSFYLWIQQYLLIKYFLKSHGVMTVLTSWSLVCHEFLSRFDSEYNASGLVDWNAADDTNQFHGIDVAIDHCHPGPTGYKLFVDNLETTLFNNQDFLKAINHDNLGNISK